MATATRAPLYLKQFHFHSIIKLIPRQRLYFYYHILIWGHFLPKLTKHLMLNWKVTDRNNYRARLELDTLIILPTEVWYMLDCLTKEIFSSRRINFFVLFPVDTEYSTAQHSLPPFIWLALCFMSDWSFVYANVSKEDCQKKLHHKVLELYENYFHISHLCVISIEKPHSFYLNMRDICKIP